MEMLVIAFVFASLALRPPIKKINLVGAFMTGIALDNAIREIWQYGLRPPSWWWFGGIVIGAVFVAIFMHLRREA